MTRSQYEHHAEQMEAYRAEFKVEWNKFVKIYHAGFSEKELAPLELKFWKRWYQEKKEGWC